LHSPFVIYPVTLWLRDWLLNHFILIVVHVFYSKDVPFPVGYISCTNRHFLEVTFQLGLLIPSFFKFISHVCVNFLPYCCAHIDVHFLMKLVRLYQGFLFLFKILGSVS
jgi:hypothetical protein